jgi:hypothetical protein
VAEGICCRLYNAKIKFISPDLCPPCLSHPEYMKIKARLEKSFPDISGDLTKVKEHIIFSSHRSDDVVTCRPKDMKHFARIVTIYVTT